MLGSEIAIHPPTALV